MIVCHDIRPMFNLCRKSMYAMIFKLLQFVTFWVAWSIWTEYYPHPYLDVTVMQAKREKNKGEFIYCTRKGVDENELHTMAKLVELGVKLTY